MGIKKEYEYNDAYQKENIKRVVVKFNRKVKRDQIIFEYLKAQTECSEQEYIKRAVEAMMENK